MTTLAQLRKAALNLPEVEEGTHFGMVAFAVRGKGFASLTKDGLVQLQLSDADAEAALAEHATAERLVRMGKPIGLRVPLADISGKELNALVLAAWSHRAPMRLAARLDAAGTRATAGSASVGRAAAGGVVEGSASAGEDAVGGVPADDLPTGIGKPATRALTLAGLTTLDQVATRTEAELLALHGVGPKAIRILSEELHRRGMSLR